MYKLLTQNLKKEYEFYKEYECQCEDKSDISYDDLIEKSVNISLNSNSSSYIDTMFSARKYIEKYLINKCKDDIGLEILMLDKYRCVSFPILHKFSNILSKKEIDNIYEEAFEYLFDNYNEEEMLGKNIITTMLNMIKEKYYGKDVETKEENEKKVSINDYINKEEFFNISESVCKDKEEIKVLKTIFYYDNKDFSIDDISKKSDKSKEYLLSIYKKYLNIYYSSLVNSVSETFKLCKKYERK